MLMDGIDISGAEKCMSVLVAAQPVGQADTCVARLCGPSWWAGGGQPGKVGPLGVRLSRKKP